MSPAAPTVAEHVLDDDSCMAVRRKLEAFDLEAVEYRSVAEPSSVGLIDKVLSLRKRALLPCGHIEQRRLKSIDQFDGMDPEPAHLSWYMAAQIREVAVLRSDQIAP